jgi:hypothetical protein
MSGLKWAITLVGMAIFASSASAAPVDLTRSDPLRRVLLDAMRPTIEEDVGVPVQFVVDTLRVEDGWAYFAGTPQQKNGEPINFEQTRYAEAIAEGFFDGPFLQAVLEKVDGEWLVVVFDIGATDVVAIGWPDEFGVPCTVVGQC